MIELLEIKNLVTERVYSELSKNNKVLFESLKQQSLEIIKLHSKLDISLNERPENTEWLLTPFAWIITYLCQDLFTYDDKYRSMISERYNEAIKILRANVIEEGIQLKGRSGIIEGMI